MNNGTTVDDWQLLAGTSVGDNSLYDSGMLSAATMSAVVSGLPEDGSTIHVTLRWNESGVPSEVNYTYTAATVGGGGPMILSPANGAVLSGASETFTWTPNGEAVGRWRLEIGTSPGSSDLFLQGFGDEVLSTTVGGLPTDGSTVYVRLEWRIAGVVSGADYVYTAAGGGPGTPALTSPVPGSTLPTGDVNFIWSANGTLLDSACRNDPYTTMREKHQISRMHILHKTLCIIERRNTTIFHHVPNGIFIPAIVRIEQNPL